MRLAWPSAWQSLARHRVHPRALAGCFLCVLFVAPSPRAHALGAIACVLVVDSARSCSPLAFPSRLFARWLVHPRRSHLARSLPWRAACSPTPRRLSAPRVDGSSAAGQPEPQPVVAVVDAPPPDDDRATIAMVLPETLVPGGARRYSGDALAQAQLHHSNGMRAAHGQTPTRRRRGERGRSSSCDFPVALVWLVSPLTPRCARLLLCSSS